jgi:hypothetical protein
MHRFCPATTSYAHRDHAWMLSEAGRDPVLWMPSPGLRFGFIAVAGLAIHPTPLSGCPALRLPLRLEELYGRVDHGGLKYAQASARLRALHSYLRTRHAAGPPGLRSRLNGMWLRRLPCGPDVQLPSMHLGPLAY